MAQCQSPEELLELVSRVVDAMINQYLLRGTLQGGLVACGEDSYLPKDTEVVLCRQLHELVQEGIDTGKIVAPTVVKVRYEGSTLILHLADGENLTLDLKPLIDGVNDHAFTDCCGNDIVIGDVLVTCACLETQLTSLTNELKAYAEQQTADVLIEANTYTDEKAADTLQQANTYTDAQISKISNINVDIPYLRNGVAVGTKPIVGVTGLALGYNTAASGASSTALGQDAKASGESSTVLGQGASASSPSTTAIGQGAKAISYYSTALGQGATASGASSTALGQGAKASGYFSTALGTTATASGYYSTALGNVATASGAYSTTIGNSAVASGAYSTTIGQGAKASGYYSTALGQGAIANYDRTTALGYMASVTGADQVQLGGSGTTTYAYGAVQNRSDKRDKTDVHNSDLGLEFIQKLRPVKFRWDYRDDYINELFHKPKREGFIDTSVVNEADYLVEITDVVREPDEPNLSEADFESTESYELAQQAVYARNLERQAKYEAALQERREEQLANLAQAESLVQEQQEAAYAQALQAHQAECRAFMQNPDERKDGSKARQRYHYGLIADELKGTLDELGVDFGGYQDHSINGDMCVKSVGYEELISPLIKAVQELSAQVDDLKQQLEGK